MTIMNCTPHAINIIDSEGKEILTLEPSGICPRCSVERKKVGDINGIPINKSVFGDVYDLPSPQPDTIYIVSRLVAEATRREDLYIVDDAVRDENGRIIGCRALASVL